MTPFVFRWAAALLACLCLFMGSGGPSWAGEWHDEAVGGTAITEANAPVADTAAPALVPALFEASEAPACSGVRCAPDAAPAAGLHPAALPTLHSGRDGTVPLWTSVDPATPRVPPRLG